MRNVPLLLQLFFWYFAVLKNLPPPRQSYALPGGVFFNVRGLYVPAPEPQPGFSSWRPLVALVIAFGISVWARRRQARDGPASRCYGCRWR